MEKGEEAGTDGEKDDKALNLGRAEKVPISIISHLRQHKQILLLTVATTSVSFTQCNDICLYLIGTAAVLEAAR